ncbi:hypothetical protein [Flavobacterium suncheonense]|uniref:DUF3575 domain-containing protein n=1 Tax=Flavobacterium suncheonense GH29-5 = DSM 17707 TaxID=1121899 RepID=A0A0A2MBA5_9FLAO|nr:hypothetical protein [Flavobacterium suncheonense]KGO89972.1 hypothetical protein Q764_05015 [Flavobacterium suncheonense GH29-5 = DSM 17707]
MKKLALVAVFFFQFAHAQQQDSTEVVSPISLKKNEVRLDVVSLITKMRIHASYERFLNKDFSVGLSASISESNKEKKDFDENFDRTLPQYEVIPYLRYSLSKSQVSYYYVEAFASANGGKYKTKERFVEGGNGYYQAVENTYFDVALGGAVGYKLYFKDKFAVDLFVGMGKNLFNTDKSPEIVQRVGASFGYRF